MGNRIKSIAEGLLGRTLTGEDGRSLQEIEQMAQTLGCQLPWILKEFYLLVGHNEQFMSAFQSFPEPYWADNKLIFLEENQCVCYWGIDKKDIANDDPLVYVCNDIEEASPVWYLEEITLSGFLEVILYYQFAMGGYEYIGCAYESEFESTEEYILFLNELTAGWEKVVSHNGLDIYQKDHKLIWHYLNTDGSIGDTLYVSALTEEEYNYFEPYELNML